MDCREAVIEKDYEYIVYFYTEIVDECQKFRKDQYKNERFLCKALNSLSEKCKTLIEVTYMFINKLSSCKIKNNYLGFMIDIINYVEDIMNKCDYEVIDLIIKAREHAERTNWHIPARKP